MKNIKRNYNLVLFQLKILLEAIEKDWETWSSKPELSVLKDYAERGNAYKFRYASEYSNNHITQLINHINITLKKLKFFKATASKNL